MILGFFSLRLRPSGFVARYVVLIFILGLAMIHWLYSSGNGFMLGNSSQAQAAQPFTPFITYGGVQSPIRELMVNASVQFEHLVGERTGDMWAASSRYRIRRGRHPPPGFDKWVDAAVGSNSVIVEEFFDRIYKDLTPFWGLEPKVLRERARSWPWIVSVRKGQILTHEATLNHPPGFEEWSNLIGEFSMHMPDVDMPLNLANEARLLVPFGEISKLVHEESQKRKLVPLVNVTPSYMGLSDVDEQGISPYEPTWIPPEQNLWDMAVSTCAPDSRASRTDHVSHNDVPSDWVPEYAFGGFVRNWTAATDPCEQPHIRDMHRVFTQPRSTPATSELIPLFSGSKLSINNDILIPAAMYLTGDETSLDGDSLRGPWAGKKEKIFWRGDAERLVKMLDGRLVSRLESTEGKTAPFSLPSKDLYASERRERRSLGSWLKGIADASMARKEPPLTSQLAHRFLPSVDGATLTPRFRSLLRSTSLPLKSTLFTEWHDDRLVPWMHFVPLDSTLQDLHAVLEFFADGSGVGDAAARFIAERGAEWADKVLRREDMKLYVWRLLLEWARVADDNRDTLGFTEDVMEHPD